MGSWGTGLNLVLLFEIMGILKWMIFLLGQQSKHLLSKRLAPLKDLRSQGSPPTPLHHLPPPPAHPHIILKLPHTLLSKTQSPKPHKLYPFPSSLLMRRILTPPKIKTATPKEATLSKPTHSSPKPLAIEFPQSTNMNPSKQPVANSQKKKQWKKLARNPSNQKQ